MSKIEVNEIDAQSGSTITVGSACKSVAVPGNVVKTNAVQASDAGNIISQSGTTITIGASGDTVSLASGASQSGFGRAGSVDWQTGSIKTSTFTAANGEGYFVDTSSGAVEVDLPAGTAGNIVAINDYAQTAATNNITVDPNGTQKIENSTASHIISANGATVTLVYVDDTRGWKVVDVGNNSTLVPPAAFTAATGGTVTCSGDYKIHTFTGPGTFCVSAVGNGPINPSGGPNTASYFVVAGGGGAGIGGPGDGAGGGAGGGVREGRDITPSYTASPLVAPVGLTLTASPFTITVGSGGAGSSGTFCGGTTGSPSTFSTITSSGGGGAGKTNATPNVGLPGGSGGGGAGGGGGGSAGGTGNTPPVSPPQGNNGGDASAANTPVNFYGGGGGGAAAAGADATNSANGAGGNGVTTQISGSPSNAGGGGGVSTVPGRSPDGGNSGGGSGGGGNGGHNPGQDGTTNTGGGGAGSTAGGTRGGNGGSGIIRIRYKFQ